VKRNPKGKVSCVAFSCSDKRKGSTRVRIPDSALGKVCEFCGHKPFYFVSVNSTWQLERYSWATVQERLKELRVLESLKVEKAVNSAKGN
jgi:hypothetical protein